MKNFIRSGDSTVQAELFWNRAEIQPNGCIIWKGSKFQNGYGRYPRSNGKGTQKAHVIAYRWFVGEVPEGLMLDHLCRNRLCVSPAHLETVSNEENQRRGFWGKDHCVNGHKYSEENTHYQFKTGRANPTRRCRECSKLSTRKSRSK